MQQNEDIVILNKAALYVRQNEQTSWLQFVHIYDEVGAACGSVTTYVLLDRFPLPGVHVYELLCMAL